MRRWSLLLGLAVASLMAAQAHASSAMDININNHSAYGGLSWGLGGDGSLVGEGQFYYNTDNAYAGSLGLLVIGETGESENPIEAGVGAKIIGAFSTEDDFTGFGMAPGVAVRVYPPEANRLVLGFHANFSPEVVSFGDAQSIFEMGARVEYLLIPQAFAYVGYRRLAVSDKRIDDGSNNNVLDTGIHVGVRMLFSAPN